MKQFVAIFNQPEVHKSAIISFLHLIIMCVYNQKVV